MRELTKIMIKKYALETLKYDFMGYFYEDINELSLHHLLISKADSKTLNLPESGYLEWNCVVLNYLTSHSYLHVIEKYDMDIYDYINRELLDEKMKEKIDLENIKYIDGALSSFEREYSGKYSKKNHPIIKEEYTRRLIKPN